jgi:hypothetical protein
MRKYSNITSDMTDILGAFLRCSKAWLVGPVHSLRDLAGPVPAQVPVA